jgi:hypothetical protein
MVNQLSILDTEQEISLETNKEDMMSLFIKVIFGIVPFGSPIGEAITTVIPHQKLERVINFVQILNYKIKNAERRIEEHELKTEEFTDLLEDALGQASRALSKERLEYIASLLKNSLTNEELEHIENKKLLSLLGELNDAEIIWLQSFLPIPYVSDEFLEKHEKVLSIPPLYQDCSKFAEDKQAVQKSYKEKLIQLGLLRAIYQLGSLGAVYQRYEQDEFPEFDEETGKLKVSYYQVSTLGYSLLRIIGVRIKEN